jgi:predicted permease
VLVAQLSTSVNRVVLDLSHDWHIVAFTAAVTVATTLLFGTAPAFRSIHTAPIDALKAQGRAGSTDARMSLAHSLVVAQVALSLMLVVAAGLFGRTFERLATAELGFDADRVLVANVNTARARVDRDQRIPMFYKLVTGVAAVPGVSAAGGSFITPASNTGGRALVDVPGAPTMSEPQRLLWMNLITPGWFATYGTPVLRGRDFDERDSSTAPPVVVINEALARKFFPDRNPVGGTVVLAPDRVGEAALPRTVVGMAGNAVYFSAREGIEPTLYLPIAQFPTSLSPNISISIRSSAGPPGTLSRSVAAALTATTRDLTFTFRPLADQVNASLTQERLVAQLSGFFGMLALLLAALGLYGVTSYAVSRRRTEIGIRMALGAAPGAIVTLVLSRVVILVAIGAMIGSGLSLWATKFVAALLYGLQPRDPTTLLGAVAVLAIVSIAAGGLPVRRASRIDPAEVLRES